MENKKKSPRELLHEMMGKINPTFLNESEEKQPQNEAIPEVNKDKYIAQVDQIKQKLDSLLNTDEDFEVIDSLYRLLIKRVPKQNITPTMSTVNEDDSPDHKRKIDLMKGKLDFLYDNDHYDIIDKIDMIINKLHTEKMPEEIPELSEDKK
jgi:flagellin-specific chaperone FliS